MTHLNQMGAETASLPNRTRSGFQKPPLRGEARLESSNAPSAPATLKTRHTSLKLLVWIYFWLLIFEGAFRKWWLPQLSDPLLVIRDPVALAIIVMAQQQGLFPKTKLFHLFIFQAVAGLILMGAQFVLYHLPPFVLVYGYRTLFLHLPLIFVIPYILSYEDIRRMGQWFLLLSIPMAILMAYQFNSPADAWVNRTVGMSGTQQITSAMGKIRPPGTFSFVSGSIGFFALVTAFVGYGLVSQHRAYPKWLLAAAAIAIGLAVAVSGSRATILSGGIVVFAWILGAVAGQRVSNAVANSLVIVLVAVFVLGQVDLFHEGAEVLSERFELGREAESEGLTGRFLGELSGPLLKIPHVPFFGAGIGVGTNVGANVLTGKMQFLISEGEWGRNILEMGPLFGLLFIGFRVALTLQLGRDCLRAARQGHLLPILLFSACSVSLFSGQIAQPTILGFTVLASGLCWAALRHLEPRIEPEIRPERLPFRKAAT